MKLLSEDAKKHYRYCPCCHTYEKGREPSVKQMGEFLEFVRQQHFLVKNKKIKKLKPRDKMLDGDSVSDITDLS